MYSGNLINSLNAMAERAVERASEPGLLPAEKPDSLEIGSDHSSVRTRRASPNPPSEGGGWPGIIPS